MADEKPARRSAMRISGPRRSKASKPKTKAKAKAAKPSKAAGSKTTKASAAKPAAEKATAKAAAKSSGASAAGGKKKPPPNMQERMEGVQGWMAEIERKQERMTRIGGAAALLDVLAAGGAIYLGVMNQQDGATKDDVDELTEQVNELGASVKSQTEEGLKKLNTRIAALETQVTALQTQQTKNTQDIAAVQAAQATAATTAKGNANGLTPAVPGSKP